MKLKYLILFLISFSIFAQETDEDLDEYFNEGISKFTPIAKIHPGALLVGELSGSVEVNIGDFVGLEVGGGVLFPFIVFDITGLGMEQDLLNGANLEGGVSWMIMPKLYLRGEAPEGMYYGLLFRQRRYAIEESTIFTASNAYVFFDGVVNQDFALVYGAQGPIGNRFYWEYHGGIGFRKQVAVQGRVEAWEHSGISFPLALKFGMKLF